MKRNVHVNQDHPPLALQQVNVVDHLDPPAVHVQDRLAHQVLVDQQPARLVHERRVLLPLLGGQDKDRVLLDPHDSFPGDHLCRLAPSVADEDADGLGVRLGHLEDQVGQLADAEGPAALADPPVQQLGEEEQPEVLSVGCRLPRCL